MKLVSNHAFRYMYALFMFEGWIAGLSLLANLPYWAILIEVLGLAGWIFYEALFAYANAETWVLGLLFGIVGMLSIFFLITSHGVPWILVLSVIGAVCYGVFGVLLNIDSLKEAHRMMAQALRKG
jgi:high-affinity Fe2+/Pb2+ permease